MRLTSLLIALVSLLPLPLGIDVRAQEEPVEGEFGEDLLVTEILLDVLVTDREDRVILGLGRDDFEVSEDGEPVDLQSVTFYSSRRLLDSSERLASRGVEIDVEPQDRLFIVLLQDLRQGSTSPRFFSRQMDAARAVERWLVEEAQAEDRIAVLSFGRKLVVHQDFTSDREALLDAVAGAARGRDPSKMPPSRRRQVEGAPAAFSALPAGKELRDATTDLYETLRLVAGTVSDLPGRKNLIFLGRGFGEFGSFGLYRPDLPRMTPTLNALNDANVAVYPVDLTPDRVRYNTQESLSELAASTGGRFFYDLLSFAPALETISDLTSGYYLLSYQSRRPADLSGYQRVRVTTRNPSFRVRARDGYAYGPEPCC